jgi:hypothetical protein
MKRKPDEDVELAMELTAMCETFNCLPGAGGLLDQDPLFIFMIREVRVAQAEKAAAERSRSGGSKL